MDELFQTDRVKGDLKGLSVRSGIFAMLAQVPTFLLHLLSIVVLARLLVPEDFGLIAMVTAFTSLVTMFESMGLSTAIVQKSSINHEQVSSLFWINVVIGIMLGVVTMALAPLLVWLYGRQELFLVTLVFACATALGGLANQHVGILQRKMRFGVLSTISVMSMTVGVLAGIIAAMCGAGYWALVVMPVTNRICNILLVWIVSGWVPSMPKRGTGVRDIMDFGWKLTWSRIIYHFTGQIDYILVGKWLGAGPLGIYTKSYQLLTLPQSKIKAPVSNVVISALSRLNDSPERFARYYLRVIKGIAWLTAPLTGLLASVATDMIVVVLGDQWAQAGPIFKIFAFAAFFRPVHSSVIWIFTSCGEAIRFRNWSILLFAITALSVIIGLPYGIKGVAVAHTIGYIFFIMPWSFPYALRGTKISLKDVVRSVFMPVALGLLMYAVGELAGAYFCEAQSIVRVAISAGFCAISFAVLYALLPSVRKDLLELVELRAFLSKNAN